MIPLSGVPPVHQSRCQRIAVVRAFVVPMRDALRGARFLDASRCEPQDLLFWLATVGLLVLWCLARRSEIPYAVAGRLSTMNWLRRLRGGLRAD